MPPTRAKYFLNGLFSILELRCHVQACLPGHNDVNRFVHAASPFTFREMVSHFVKTIFKLTKIV
jgi:hypothetical protein